MNNTLANGFRILEFLANSADAYSVKELAEIFDLPNSHICRLLKTLVETGYVEQTAKRQYKISLNILCLSNACLTKLTVRNKVRPYLHQLMSKVECDVYLVVPQNGRALIVDALYPNGKISDIGVTIGCVNQLHASACGKLCAAYTTINQQKTLIKNNDLPKYTAQTKTTEKELLEEFAKIQNQEYSIADSEKGEGVYAIAAPVYGFEGNLIAAIGTYKTDITEQCKKTMLEETVDIAQSASFAMGYSI